MLSIILYSLFALACLVLVLAVLLQPGKADAGALFTSSVSSTAFGPRGTQTILAKITIAAAAVFMLAALIISMGIGGPRSVVNPGETGPAAPAASPATPDAGASPAAATENAPAPPAEPQNEGGIPAGDAGATPAPADSPQTPAASPEASK
ncbi:MAG TPA: preprotein translocase subunit SecG [Pyrinomonadaceae bacterium]|nr:preprotein translocase subunit SecG [Pyrinomonadaceae bacterium]